MEFGRGYGYVREKMSQYSKFLMSCYNCEHYYQAMGDAEELCQNPDVLEYDMVNTETTIYCLKWKPIVGTKQERAKHGFKSGVSLRGHKKKKIQKSRTKNGKRVKR